MTSQSPLVIDGTEGGGQILRTSLSLSAIGGRPVRIVNVRGARARPGLAAQHLTAVRAAAAICDAAVSGDALGSQEVSFAPRRPPRAGDYVFDVGAARQGGSAGAATLVLQTVLLPLAFAEGTSIVTVHGGTHMVWRPPYDYIARVWLPVLQRMGFAAAVELVRTGWYPIGQGRVRARVQGPARGAAPRLRPLDLVDRGRLVGIEGRAITSRLPGHVAERMCERARDLLGAMAAPLSIEPVAAEAACAGAGLFLVACYENVACGFSALGARGKPAEMVAEEAAQACLAHHASSAAVDLHLSDQLLLPMAVAGGVSRFSAATLSDHLQTNRRVIESFGLADIRAARLADGRYAVECAPRPPSQR